MITNQTKYQFIAQSSDDNGIFEIRVQRDCMQIQVETGMGVGGFSNEVFFETNLKGVICIRDMLNAVITEKSRTHISF